MRAYEVKGNHTTRNQANYGADGQMTHPVQGGLRMNDSMGAGPHYPPAMTRTAKPSGPSRQTPVTLGGSPGGSTNARSALAHAKVQLSERVLGRSASHGGTGHATRTGRRITYPTPGNRVDKVSTGGGFAFGGGLQGGRGRDRNAS